MTLRTAFTLVLSCCTCLLTPLLLSAGEAGNVPPDEVWTGRLNTSAGSLRLELHVTGTGEERRAELISVDQGGARLAVDAFSIKGGVMTFAIGRIGARFRGTLNTKGTVAKGTWRQGDAELPLTLHRQDEAYETSDVWEHRPQRPEPPFPYEAAEVTFTNARDDVTLAGTLTVPEGPGPHPAAVLISGSGPQDRDETIFEHKPFLVLADYLSRRGIAVLRYDDRGFGASTGVFSDATSEDFARDASAAVDFLQAHRAIDPERIGLIGHSEGGLIAPMAAAERGDVDYIVLMAAPGVDGAAVLRSQAAAIARANGTDARSIEIQDHILRAVFDAAARADTPEAVGPAVQQAVDEAIDALPEAQRAVARQVRKELRTGREQLATPWFRFFLRYDPYRTLTRASCPVLAISGDRDVQVVADVNVPHLEQALEEAGNDASEVVLLEGLNHLFQQSETGAMAEYATIDETINPRALKAIGDWIAAIQ